LEIESARFHLAGAGLPARDIADPPEMATSDCHVRRRKVAGGDPVAERLSANTETLNKFSKFEKIRHHKSHLLYCAKQQIVAKSRTMRSARAIVSASE
jgi:hypothetical protein